MNITAGTGNNGVGIKPPGRALRLARRAKARIWAALPAATAIE